MQIRVLPKPPDLQPISLFRADWTNIRSLLDKIVILDLGLQIGLDTQNADPNSTKLVRSGIVLD